MPYEALVGSQKGLSDAEKTMLLLRSMKDPEARKLVEVSAGPLMDHNRAVEALKAHYELIYRRVLQRLIKTSRTTSFSFDGLSSL